MSFKPTILRKNYKGVFCDICRKEFVYGETVLITDCNHICHWDYWKMFIKSLHHVEQLKPVQSCPICYYVPLRRSIIQYGHLFN